MRLLLVVTLLGTLLGCKDDGTAKLEGAPRPVSGLPGCSLSKVKAGGLYNLFVVSCDACASTTTTVQGVTPQTTFTLECAAKQ